MLWFKQTVVWCLNLVFEFGPTHLTHNWHMFKRVDLNQQMQPVQPAING